MPASGNNANKYTRKVIKLYRQASNVYTIPCKVNGLALNFIFDTGASSVSISKSEAIFMLKMDIYQLMIFLVINNFKQQVATYKSELR